MTLRSDRVAPTAQRVLLAAMLVGTIVCIVDAATDDSDRPEIHDLLDKYALAAHPGDKQGKPGKPAPGKKDKTPADLRAERLAKRPIFSPPKKAAFSVKLQGVLGHLAYFAGNATGMEVGQSIGGAKITEIGPNWVKVDFKGKVITLQITAPPSKGKAPPRPSKPGGPAGPSTAPGPRPAPTLPKGPVLRIMPGGAVPPAGVKVIRNLKGRVTLEGGSDIIEIKELTPG